MQKEGEGVKNDDGCGGRTIDLLGAPPGSRRVWRYVALVWRVDAGCVQRGPASSSCAAALAPLFRVERVMNVRRGML
eukprot:scaffold35692_cov101-Isochrysis_galbana.AAC.1